MANVLVVAAHPDDEILGCGGTIARHKAKGDEVHVVIAAEGVTARGADRGALEALKTAASRASRLLGVDSLTLHDFPDNRMDSLALLDVTRFVEEHVEKRSPGIVYTHHWGDLNTDHAVVSRSVITACRPTPEARTRRILCFEVPSSTGWRGPVRESFEPNWFVDISSVLDRKLAALEAYAVEMREFPHARSLEAITHLARWRGAGMGVAAAEAFVLVRSVEA